MVIVVFYIAAAGEIRYNVFTAEATRWVHTLERRWSYFEYKRVVFVL